MHLPCRQLSKLSFPMRVHAADPSLHSSLKNPSLTIFAVPSLIPCMMVDLDPVIVVWDVVQL